MDFNVIGLSNQECVGYYYCKVQTAIGLQYARNPKIRNIQLYISNFHCPNWVWLEVVKLFNQNHSDVKIVRSSTLNMIEHSGTICYMVEYSKEKEMTLEEIEKELGHKVKIVNRRTVMENDQ